MTRYYTGHDVAATILGDCVRRGTSTGWAGSIEDQQAMADILEPYGVRYTCDMSGTWASVQAVTPAHNAAAWLARMVVERDIRAYVYAVEILDTPIYAKAAKSMPCNPPNRELE